MSEAARVHVNLTGQERKQLYTALIGAFDLSTLAQLLSFELDERLDAIATQGGLSKIVLEVIDWAELQGRVVELAQAAKRQQPDNVAVIAACKTVEDSAARRRVEIEPADEPAPAPPRAAPAPRARARRTQPPGSSLAPPPPVIPTMPPPAIAPPVTPQQPTASISMLQVVHNLMVPHPGGLMPGLGMRIIVPGMLSGAMGQIAQLVVRFMFPNGQMVLAAPQEFMFKDPNGYCATATPAIPVTTPIVDLSTAMIMIPYYALNLAPTNGMMIYQLNAVATLYASNVMIAQSAPMPFSVRW